MYTEEKMIKDNPDWNYKEIYASKQANKHVEIEIETFIHGAMCAGYSGRCVMSNYVTYRDSNRGGCCQVCRYNFNIDDSDDFSVAVKDLNASYLIKNCLIKKK